MFKLSNENFFFEYIDSRSSVGTCASTGTITLLNKGTLSLHTKFQFDPPSKKIPEIESFEFFEL